MSLGRPTTPRVVHCKREPFDVYIGRPSKWGNPYPLPPGPARLSLDQRALVLARYRSYLMQESKAGRLDPTELRGKTLGCWCAPLPCHGDILLALANKETNE